MRTGYAIYRLPHADQCTMMIQEQGEPSELALCSELNGREGFVFAPFEVSAQEPLLLLHPDHIEEMKVEELLSVETRLLGDRIATVQPPLSSVQSSLSLTERYHIDFSNFHAQLEEGIFRKIVLSRCVQEETDEALSPVMLFVRACRLYPRMFVALVSTSKSGTWLMATPEILLESVDGTSSCYKTIALAGTMKLEGSQLDFDNPHRHNVQDILWSQKNIQEQRYVATYIMECLEHFSRDINEEGPSTVRAANLVHLRSDFTFTLDDRQHLGSLLQNLHPTPAVCGLPKREAYHFILHNESTPRHYYSGFCGVLNPEGATHLYVSLRCMQIHGNHYHLYAGGGLLRDSVEQMEWEETEAKLNTMRNVLK